MAESREETRAEYLRSMNPGVAVTFHPDAFASLNWSAGSRLVDFVSRYAGFFFDSPSTVYLDREEVEDAINYILLELVENALKYSLQGDDVDVALEMQLDEVQFAVVNPINTGDMSRLETTFHELYSDDPADLMVRRIEENAAAPDSLNSGLGLLTILSDYGATVAWQFSDSPQTKRARLTITTRFPVYRSER